MRQPGCGPTSGRGRRESGQRPLGVHRAAAVELAVALGDLGEAADRVDVAEEDDLAQRASGRPGRFEHADRVACAVTVGHEAAGRRAT